jgi:hypothetical protein
VACSHKDTPKSQDSDGNCKTAFIESYNKLQGSSFDVQTAGTVSSASDSTNVLADTCKTMLKTYGSNSEPCRATDLKTGDETYLSTKGIQDICSKSIKSQFYGSATKN